MRLTLKRESVVMSRVHDGDGDDDDDDDDVCRRYLRGRGALTRRPTRIRLPGAVSAGYPAYITRSDNRECRTGRTVTDCKPGRRSACRDVSADVRAGVGPRCCPPATVFRAPRTRCRRKSFRADRLVNVCRRDATRRDNRTVRRYSAVRQRRPTLLQIIYYNKRRVRAGTANAGEKKKKSYNIIE